jgi:hypothetical protein
MRAGAGAPAAPPAAAAAPLRPRRAAAAARGARRPPARGGAGRHAARRVPTTLAAAADDASSVRARAPPRRPSRPARPFPDAPPAAQGGAASGAAAKLPRGVTLLRPLPGAAGASPVYLIGTSHCAPASAADVEALIAELRCARAAARMPSRTRARPPPRKTLFLCSFRR